MEINCLLQFQSAPPSQHLRKSQCPVHLETGFNIPSTYIHLCVFDFSFQTYITSPGFLMNNELNKILFILYLYMNHHFPFSENCLLTSRQGRST